MSFKRAPTGGTAEPTIKRARTDAWPFEITQQQYLRWQELRQCGGFNMLDVASRYPDEFTRDDVLEVMKHSLAMSRAWQALQSHAPESLHDPAQGPAPAAGPTDQLVQEPVPDAAPVQEPVPDAAPVQEPVPDAAPVQSPVAARSPPAMPDAPMKPQRALSSILRA